MEQKAECVTVRLYPSEKKLATKLAAMHNLRGRGRLFALYMREDVAKLKASKVSDSAE